MSQPRPYVIPARRREYTTTPPTPTTSNPTRPANPTTRPTKTPTDKKNNKNPRVDNKTTPAQAPPPSPPTRSIAALDGIYEGNDIETTMMYMLARSGHFGAPGQVRVGGKWVDRREVFPAWTIDGRRVTRRELTEWTREQIRLLRESMFPQSTSASERENK